MSVRAKFKVNAITRSESSRPKLDAEGNQIKGATGYGEYEPCEVRTVKMSPVSGGSPENLKFWNASPSGSLEIGCANLAAAEAFELGKEYYVDFTPAG